MHMIFSLEITLKFIGTPRLHRIRIYLREQGLSPETLGPFLLDYTFAVLPSSDKLHDEVTPPMPVHVRRLLSSTGLSEAIFPNALPGPFDHAFATSLDDHRRCIPLSACSSPECLGIIYGLSAHERQSILDKILHDYFILVNDHSRELEYLRRQYAIAQLVLSLQGPIHYLPNELLGEIFLISVEQLGVTWKTLQGVCRTWRALIPRLWGALQVGTWTERQKIETVVEQNPLSIFVVIDTTIDETLSVTSETPYAALALA
jgi:hypothetical protein